MACFIGADNIKEVLGDFTKQINRDDTNKVVKKCAKLAHNKGYKLFALGSNGLCLSEANMKQKYHISGSEGAKCKDGIGMWNSMFVYSLGKVALASHAAVLRDSSPVPSPGEVMRDKALTTLTHAWETMCE